MDQQRQDPTPRAWWRASGVRRGVALLVGIAVGLGVGRVVRDATPPRSDRPTTSSTTDRRQLLDAWARSQRSTFTLEGVSRRTVGDDEPIEDQLVVVQRSADRISLGFGSWDGVVGGRGVHCLRDGRSGPYRGCTWGDVADRRDTDRAELDRLAELTAGPSPAYRVTASGGGCFGLRLTAGNLPTPYGRSARVCFDDATGALERRRVEHDGALDETIATRLRSTVDPSDLPTPP